MHRFTDPTPLTLARQDFVQVVVEAWEIECCAPPPVVGEATTWRLSFQHPQGDPGDALCSERDWLIGPDGTLTSGAITAFRPDDEGPPPPGPVRLRGLLSGTVHGGRIPDALPAVTGMVQRIRVISRRYRRADGSGAAVPEWVGLDLTEISRSPRWFTGRRVAAPGEPDQPPRPVGLLLDLLVDRPTTSRGNGA